MNILLAKDWECRVPSLVSCHELIFEADLEIQRGRERESRAEHWGTPVQPSLAAPLSCALCLDNWDSEVSVIATAL